MLRGITFRLLKEKLKVLVKTNVGRKDSLTTYISRSDNRLHEVDPPGLLNIQHTHMSRSPTLHHRKITLTLRYPLPPYLKNTLSLGGVWPMLHCSLWPGLPSRLEGGSAAREAIVQGVWVKAKVWLWSPVALYIQVHRKHTNSRILVCVLQSGLLNANKNTVCNAAYHRWIWFQPKMQQEVMPGKGVYSNFIPVICNNKGKKNG